MRSKGMAVFRCITFRMLCFWNGFFKTGYVLYRTEAFFFFVCYYYFIDTVPRVRHSGKRMKLKNYVTYIGCQTFSMCCYVVVSSLTKNMESVEYISYDFACYYLLPLFLFYFSSRRRLIVSQSELFETLKRMILYNNTENIEACNVLIEYLKVKLQLETCSTTTQGELRYVVKSFIITFNEKWKKASRNRIFFKSKNSALSRTDLTLKTWICHAHLKHNM